MRTIGSLAADGAGYLDVRGKARTKRLQVTMSEREAATLKEVATWLGMSRAEYVRMCVFGETAYHRKKIAEARGKRYR